MNPGQRKYILEHLHKQSVTEDSATKLLNVLQFI